MKKLLIAVSMVAALVLTSCGGKQDANGWYSDFGTAKKAAQAKNKSILLFVNSDLDVEGSGAGVEAILSKEFVAGVKNDYVLCHFAFKDMQSILGDVNREMSSKEQKDLEKRRNVMMGQFKIADMYTVQETPSITLITKDGYFASALDCDYTDASADGYISLVKNEKKYIDAVNEMADKTNKGSMKDKVNAIAALHDSMYEVHRIALGDLLRKAVQMDRKDETGTMNTLISTLVNVEAYEKMMGNNYDDAAKLYAKYAEDKRLTKENAQLLYYTAAQTLNRSSNANFEGIKHYLDLAVAVDPESEYAIQIKEILSQFSPDAGAAPQAASAQ